MKISANTGTEAPLYFETDLKKIQPKKLKIKTPKKTPVKLYSLP